MPREKGTLVFDIETVPDIRHAKRLYGLNNLNDAEAFEALKNIRRQESGGSDFFRHHLHRIVCISVVLRLGDSIRVWSLGEEDGDEADIIRRFFHAIDKYDLTLVSWNGSGFDLPVLHYRAMLHQISAPMYWEMGDHYKDFRYNNYINRFHLRHIDLMDVLSMYQARAAQPLDQIASFLGFPGKMGMDGSQVYDQFLAGNLAAIRNYCETDVLNTWLVYLRFQLLRGELFRPDHDQEIALVRDLLAASPKPHLQEFLSAWNAAQETHD
ncbi:MAG TPA: 3'-5' exonuclease [Fluviicoccus sp.]|nr:3'-5' exonuclease [Fluviicoccus sp.]